MLTLKFLYPCFSEQVRTSISFSSGTFFISRFYSAKPLPSIILNSRGLKLIFRILSSFLYSFSIIILTSIFIRDIAIVSLTGVRSQMIMNYF